MRLLSCWSETQHLSQSSLYRFELFGRQSSKLSCETVMVKAGESLDVYGGRFGKPTWLAKIDLAAHPPNLGGERSYDDQ